MSTLCAWFGTMQVLRLGIGDAVLYRVRRCGFVAHLGCARKVSCYCSIAMLGVCMCEAQAVC